MGSGSGTGGGGMIAGGGSWSMGGNGSSQEARALHDAMKAMCLALGDGVVQFDPAVLLRAGAAEITRLHGYVPSFPCLRCGVDTGRYEDLEHGYCQACRRLAERMTMNDGRH